jgi:hypothetical protein
MSTVEKLREFMVDSLEAYAQERITELFEDDREDDAYAMFLEYVVDNQNPEEWTFIDYITDEE